MILYSGEPGRVVRIDDPGVPSTVSGPFALDGWGGYGSFRSIIGRASTAYSCNYQFMHTLGNSIYVYSFGDKVGQISVSGLAFNKGCGASEIGLNSVRNYYQKNKLSVRSDPLKLTLGGTTMLGMLVGIDDGTQDPSVPMFPFNLHFALIPDPSKEQEAETESETASDGQSQNPEIQKQPTNRALDSELARYGLPGVNAPQSEIDALRSDNRSFRERIINRYGTTPISTRPGLQSIAQTPSRPEVFSTNRN